MKSIAPSLADPIGADPIGPAAASRESGATDAARAPRRNPADPLYEFVKNHLLIANNIVAASIFLVGALDFCAPRLWMAPQVVYSAAAGLLLLMVAAAAAPAFAGRLISGMGYQPRREAGPLWRKPLWQFAVAILMGVSVVGFASVAKADKGGLLASHFPAAKSLQDSLFGLSRDVADIRRGVDAANAKLDGMAARSADPQRELVTLGYPYDDHGLLRAIKQADRRALGLFVQAGYKAEDRIPMLNLLGGGGYEWSAPIAAMLPRSMFSNPAACDDAGFLSSRIREPVAERVATFKRLCPTAIVIDRLRSRVDLDKAAPAFNEVAAKDAEARKKTLALLEQ